jgi:hypothetical protein
MAFAAIATVAAPQRCAVARPAETLGESFHADQYPSQCSAITDLARQVADDLKSRPTTPKQVELLAGGGVDDALRQQFVAMLERELPETECSTAADSTSEPTTSPSGTVIARLKLRADETTIIPAPWTSEKERKQEPDLKLRSGSFTAFVVSAAGRATFTSRFAEKPWAEDWSGFVNSNPSHRWLTAQSESPAMSEGEATESARREAVEELATLVRDQLKAGARGRDPGPHIMVTRRVGARPGGPHRCAAT